MGLFNQHSDDQEMESPIPSPVIPKPVRPQSNESPYPTFLEKPIEGLSNEPLSPQEEADLAHFTPSEPPAPVKPTLPHFEESEAEVSETSMPPPVPPQPPVESESADQPESAEISEAPITPPIPPQESVEPETEIQTESVPAEDQPPVADIETSIVPKPQEPIPPVSEDPINIDDSLSHTNISQEEVSTTSEQEKSSDNTEDTNKTETIENTEIKNTEVASEDDIVDYKSTSFLESLFANGTTCVTAVNGSFPIKDDTRSLLVLFSNGRFFVSEAARFDGKVLGFEYLARKRRLQIGKPEYVPALVISDIYEYAAKNSEQSFVPPTIETTGQEQVRMQRDFVTIISRAAMNRVSDIHIIVADHTTVMFRVNGLMQTEMEYNREWGESFVRAAFASADISDANYAQNEYQAAQKLGRTPLRGSGGKLLLPRNVLGIRLQFNPIAFGSRYVVMRLLYAEDDMTAASNLEALGFTKEQNQIFYQMRAIPTGMIVISGPTGSGKSTTLQRNMIAMLQERNYEINLITVEDPPEYPIPGARQMPVTNAGVEEAKEREFTKALSAALRSDPDALMIGEIRTLSAADLAFRGALSGHNVWTTIHANSAAAVLMRLKDIGVENFKLQDPSIMRGVMAQRLFRKVCPHCRLKAKDNLNHPAVQRLKVAFGDDAIDKCYLRGPGCEECDHRGVKGRMVIGEFILPDATFLDLSIKGEFKKAQNYWINDLNGRTLRDSAISQMLTGMIDIEEVEKWTGFLDQQTNA